jgi:Flp pilus assembly protein TadB
MFDNREPPNGDFVAFVEKIEREQLVRAMQPHRLPHLSTGGKVVTDEDTADKSRTLSATQAQHLLQVLQAKGTHGARAPVAAMIGVFLGAALIAFGLMAEGGIVLVLLGAVLLWHNLRKLRRTAGTGAGSPAEQVERAFGQKAPGTAHKRNA